jgi:hypothetical protein
MCDVLFAGPEILELASRYGWIDLTQSLSFLVHGTGAKEPRGVAERQDVPQNILDVRAKATCLVMISG